MGILGKEVTSPCSFDLHKMYWTYPPPSNTHISSRINVLSATGMYWIYPPPSNSYKWRFRLGFPSKTCVKINSGGDDCTKVELHPWKFTCDLKRDHPKRPFHLTTIKFSGDMLVFFLGIMEWKRETSHRSRTLLHHLRDHEMVQP